jgi:hypothetical protein
MTRNVFSNVLVCVMAAAAGTTAAQVIDTRDTAGEFDQTTWGHPNTTLYAQSIVAEDSVFQDLTFRASSGTQIDYTLVVTGSRPNAGGAGLGLAPNFGDIRFESAIQSISTPTGGFQEVMQNLNLAVTPGETLFFVLNTFTIDATGSGTVRATQFNGPTDEYLPGEFMFLNAGVGGSGASLTSLDSQTWTSRFSANQDLAFRASFVPAPSGLAAIGLGGLVALRRRR